MKANRKLKRPDTSSKLVLEEIIGLTTKSANGLASNFLNSKCVYMAGCVVVVYDVNLGTQSHLMVSHRIPKPLSCVAVSQNGRFVAAGESGHQPAVLIWDFETLAFVSELKDHQHGIECIAFSPDGKHLVSVGFLHDGYICLWDWRSGLLITKLKSSSSYSSVASVCFSSDAKFIVTSGKKHLKFWSIGSSMRSHITTGAGSLAMHGKPVNVGHQKGSSFISVVSPIWTDGGLTVNCSKKSGELLPIYALTDAGILCLLNSEFSVQKSVDLKVEKCFALSASKKLIACACSNGIVQLLTIETLNYAGSLCYFESKIIHEANDMVSHTEKDLQPDAIACQFSTSEKLVVVYGDHSLYIWDVHDVGKATRCCVLVSHSACIWDIKNLPCENMHNPSVACVAKGCSGGVSFATCSADGTIRLWDLALQLDLSEDISTTLPMGHNSINTSHLVSAGLFEREAVESGVGTQEFRSIAVSSDGKYLAAGDCQGNLHIYNLHTSDYTCVQDAHNAEILSLSFVFPTKKNESSKSRYFLASGGRDRMIHLYDVERNFDLIESIDDHSAAVTSVKVTCNGSKIISCSADRSLIFRDVAIMDTGCKVSRRHHQMASHGTVYDMAVDPMMEAVITVGQDKKINTFSIAAGKLIKSFKPDGNFGDPIKVAMDPSCSYLLCSYSNKSICMYDYISGEMVTQAMGHGDVITGVIFLPDCKHIISVGGDGCIFVWKVPALSSSRMLQKMKESSGPLSPSSMAQPIALRPFIFQEVDDHQCETNPAVLETSIFVNDNVHRQGMTPREISAFKFSVSRLPKWAQGKVHSSEIRPRNPEITSSQQAEVSILSPLDANGEGYSLLFPDGRTPSKLDLGLGNSEQRISSMSSSSSDTDNNQSYPTPQKTFESFAMDKRWNTIHNVCLDLLNSPEVWYLKEEKQVPASNLLHEPAVKMPINDEHKEFAFGGHGVVEPIPSDLPIEHGSHVVDNEGSVTFSEYPISKNSASDCENFVQNGIQNTSACHDVVVEPIPSDLPIEHGSHVVDNEGSVTFSEYPISKNSASDCENFVQYGIQNTSACHDVVVTEVSEQSKSKSTESEVQAIMNTESEGNDLFDQHFGNLSTMKVEGRKSSARKRYSSRFTLRRDHIKGCNRLFNNTSIQDVEDEASNCRDVMLDETSMSKPENQKIVGSIEQDLKKSAELLLSPSCRLSQCESTKCSVVEDLVNPEVINARDQKESVPEPTEMHESVIACKEALLNLEAAAQSALQLFSKLRIPEAIEEKSSGIESQLYNEAAELIPSIVEKVNAVANLVQSRNNKSSRESSVKVSSLEPLLGTFAESISLRVVEMLKKNLNN